VRHPLRTLTVAGPDASPPPLSFSFEERSDELVRDTLLHEIAHALVGTAHGHDEVWKAKCLEIGAINLRGVVKSDTGFIAVVTNNLNKAYFLRENDPVFNGYVVKITGDSVTFQETIQDKLGKSFTREVVKKIFTPAV